MKKKGFTLIELLGVIVILALLTTLVFPSIINSVKNSSEDVDELTLELIYNAADLYISNHRNEFPRVNGSKKIITLNNLIEEELLESPIKISDEDVTNTMSVQVIYNGDYNYELKEKSNCEINFQNGEVVYFNVTTGKVCTDKNYTETQSNIGVKSGCMKFYAFNDSDESTKVNLLLDHNTNSGVAFESNEDDQYELLTQLQSDTSTWQGTITPENYNTISYKDDGYKARLITANEVAQIVGNTTWDETTSENSFYFDSLEITESLTCNIGDTSGCKYGWLYDRTSIDCTNHGCLNNSDIDTSGYWTSSVYGGNYGDGVWTVKPEGRLYNNPKYYLGIGVRPVIEISKTKFTE